MRTRTVIIGLSAIAVVSILAVIYIPQAYKSSQVSSQTYWPTQSWRTSKPEDQGFDSGKLAAGLLTLREDNANINSLLIIRNSYVVLDAYFYPFDNTIPHKLASVTKSFMTTLIGIAVDQGAIHLDQTMVSFFPNRSIDNLDDRKKSITVRHLASMMNGFESGCLAGDEGTLEAMRSQPDWVQAALDRPMVKEPGTSFCYDSPGMHLLSAILQEATGITALEFAQQNLFNPLGILEVFWQSDPQGYTRGWGDLYLKPLDAAKIGYLWLNNGVWEGKQIVSEAWVTDSSQPQSDIPGDDYGYGWWISDDNFYAAGRGGQYIRVYPTYNAVLVMTASGFNYDQINPLLIASFVDPENPLPANPKGVAELNKALNTLTQAPNPWPTGPLPEIVEAISGKTYVFGPNSEGVEILRLEFKERDEATLYMKRLGNDETWQIALDGTYRISPIGQGLRGYWAEPQTFVIEIFEEGLSSRQLYFDGDRLEISSPELGLWFEGWIEIP